MACDAGDGWGIYELSASDFPSVAKQIKQNIRDLSNAERYILATQRHSVEAESDDFGDDYKLPCTFSDADVEVQSASGVSDVSAAGQQDASSLVEDTVHKLPDGAVVTEVHQPFSEVHPASEAVENGPYTAIAMEVDGSISEEDNSETKEERGLTFSYNEATIIANPVAETADSKSPSAPSEPEEKLPPQQSPRSQSSASATREQRLLEGTVHQQPGGTVLAQVLRLHSKDPPAPETEENEPHVLLPSHVDASTSDENGNETEAISFPKAVASPSEQDKINVSTDKEDGSPTEENDTESCFNSQQDGVPKEANVVKEEPNVDGIVLANPLHQSNTEKLEAGTLDSPDVVIPLPGDDQNMPETVPSPETAATPSDHDKAVGIAKRMDSKNWPQPADIQLIVNEKMKPTKPLNDANADNDADEDNCCLRCSIRCKCRGKTYELGYKCTKEKCKVLARGIGSVFQYWTDGFTPRWKLLMVVGKIIAYNILSLIMVATFLYDLYQGENRVFDILHFAFSSCGILVSLYCTLYFCYRRRREFCITICELFTCITLFFYKRCCCTIKRLEELKKCEESKEMDKHKKAEKYVSEMQKFKPAQNSFEVFTARVGNASEVLLTIVDDVIFTALFILSLYNFIGKQKFTLFYGSVSAGSVFTFILLVLKTLYLFIFVHGVRFISIAVNVRALDKKIKMDSVDMKLKLPNKFIRYFLSFQSRLVFHGLASSAFQLYGIFALSWKIIQDSCSAVAAPSIPMGNGTNGSYTSLVSPGAPFTCNLHLMVNSFTIYNILYIAIAPMLLGYTSFFVCNTPWFVEYMQTIEMWTCFNKACTAGYRVRTKRENDKVAGCCVCFKNCSQDEVRQDGGQVEVIKDGGQGDVRQDGGGQDDVGKASEDTKLRKVSDKDAYMSPMLQLIRLFGGYLLCDETDDKLHELGANAERERQAIQEDHNRDAVKFGTNFVSRAVTMLGQVMFIPLAAIIGVLQVILFIVHLSFMGCCINGDVHTVLSPSVLTDAAVVFVPLIVLFLLTSAPGPWMGLFWISVVVGIIATVAALVASVVAIVALALLLCVLVVCLGSSSSRRNQF